MLRFSFLLSLAALFSFPFPVLSAPKYLPYSSSLFESDFDVLDSSVLSSSIADFESYLNTVISPINYCHVCGYGFYVEVYAIVLEDNPQRKAYWYGWNHLSANTHSASPNPSKCGYRDVRTNDVIYSSVNSGLAKIFKTINSNGDRIIKSVRVIFQSGYSTITWASAGCGKPFDVSFPKVCPNVHIRSLPVVRVRVRC